MTTRRYEMGKRAKSVAETRRRIVEAAVELHEQVGPARTSLSSIAERAGVERQTYYRHFPDQRSLYSACSDLWIKRNPPPDPDLWSGIEDPEQRLRHGLGELYAYYEANEGMISSVLRDAEIHPLTQEMVSDGLGAGVARMSAALGAGWAVGGNARAAIDLALSFATWRTLVRESGLSADRAADLMAQMVPCAG